MKYCANKNIDCLVRTLVSQGWIFYWGSKHGRLRHPLGTMVLTVPKSPSCKRAFLNFSSDVRRVYSSLHDLDNRS